MLFLCFLDVSSFKIQVYWKQHIKWSTWILLFNFPMVLVSLLDLLSFEINLINLLINSFLIFILTVLSITFYLGKERSLFIKTTKNLFIKKIFSFL